MDILDVGKYKGKSFEYVERNDPGYARWVLGLESPTNRSLVEFSNYLKNRGYGRIGTNATKEHRSNSELNLGGFVVINGLRPVNGGSNGNINNSSCVELDKDKTLSRVSEGTSLGEHAKGVDVVSVFSSNNGDKTEYVWENEHKGSDLIENSNNANMKDGNCQVNLNISRKNEDTITECEKELSEIISKATIMGNDLNSIFTGKKIKLDCGVIFSLVSPTMFRVSSEKGNKSSMSLPKVLGDYLREYKTNENIMSKKIRLFHTGMHGIDSKPYGSLFIFPGIYYDKLFTSIKERFECSLSPIPEFILDKFPEFKKYEIEDIDGDYEKISSLTPKYDPSTIDFPDCSICNGCIYENVCYESLNYLKVNYHNLYNSLRPFQRVGVLTGLKKEGRILIGDEMGLGKTLQALSIVTYFKNEWPVLIICPSSIRFQWYQQALDWLSPTISKSNISLIRTSNDEYYRKSSIIIISYDLITRNEHFRSYFGSSFKVVIADESHFLKNSTAKRTQTIVPILHSARRVVLLSGTPALNNPTELYEQINAIVRPNPELYMNLKKRNDSASKTKKQNKVRNKCEEFSEDSTGSDCLLLNKKRKRLIKQIFIKEDNLDNILIISPKFPNYMDFAHRYSDIRMNKFSHKKEFYGSRNTEELHLFIRKSAMIRRLKKQVLSELPPKQRSRIPLEIRDKSGLKKIKELLSDSSLQLDSNELEDGDLKMSSLHKLTCEIKIQPVQEYIEYLLDSSDDKYVIFAHHHIMLDAIESVLLKRRKNNYLSNQGGCSSGPFLFIRIDGKTSGSKREEYVKEFQSNCNCKIALLSITACGQGLNLTSAGTVIFAELYWVPGTMLQAEDRCHRMGTSYSSINIHYLIAEDTLDDKMWGTLCRKQKIMASTLDGIDKRKNDVQHFIVHEKQ
ncbi:HARP like SWI/SNF ATpase [Cryptosporidium ryanae]|uniref:HARP like SWI/SNF ATpase n=1 Tax=Cryptosporidium ryanae TaxID=515981 RepID=UPI00351A3CC9|nr:HARP like SWI/SNF ATpase [Cryptosporidium ryanae]